MPKTKTPSAPLDRAALARLPDYVEHTVEAFDTGGFFVSGLDGTHHFAEREDADVVAAALNHAQRFRKLERRAQALQAAAVEFLGSAQ